MISRVAAWTALAGGTVALFWGLLSVFGTPTPRCGGWRMQPGDVCGGRGYEEQLAYETTRMQVEAGIALGGGLLLVIAGLLLLARATRALSEDAGPDTGRRKLLAQQQGWRYRAVDPDVAARYPNVGLSRNAADNDYSRVLSGDLDGTAFDVFNHSYTFGVGVGAIRHEETVFLLRLPPCAASFSVEDAGQVMPPELRPMVLTEPLRRACTRARVRDWAVVDSTLIYAEPVIPDSRVKRIPARLADLRTVAAAIPSIVFSGPRID
ncbi:hypothetical protein J2S43_003304 [Catenuloplanes nepalensis]|uniref:Uncharacterized protein n=1 Tax=Catenuloplanes nepalensis TaxID=587533 RepID=A0ABT9MTN0_9ACTN|nr:hypothetical protein [Catenuloplanes nepalensis]MDP9794792.1 hypothetical protein [Catenuloplanes nepalensis]